MNTYTDTRAHTQSHTHTHTHTRTLTHTHTNTRTPQFFHFSSTPLTIIKSATRQHTNLIKWKLNIHYEEWILNNVLYEECIIK